MRFPTIPETAAFSRHIITYGGGVLTGAVALGLATPEQASATTQALKDLAHGVGEVGAALATIADTGMGIWAGVKASFPSRAASVAANPQVAAVVMKDEAAAAAIPSPKVVGPQP